ncbi:leucine efflux protein LeuE [Catenuloplanes japonicus]|uniref:leucine efflux protein LeuE n=1 Tax=Catenuloplanes japonicus TaxID=33876 RepID=UPI00052508BA|nr:leucine efflux protein LeuE [Catenuloplanes japonicus]
MMQGVLGVTDIWTYVIGTVAIVLLPGPNSLFVLSVAARRGVGAGYRAAGGVFLGDAVLMVLSAAGVASLLRAYPPLFLVIKYAGAAYLCWVGLNMLRAAWRRRRAEEPAAAEAPIGRPFRKALVISLMNPKAILFFVSFFIQFVDPGYAYPALSFLILGLIAQLCSALYLTALIFSGSYLAAQFRRRRLLARAGTTAIGALFVAFGAKLATATL